MPRKLFLKKNITILQERYLIVCWFFLPYASAGLFLIKKPWSKSQSSVILLLLATATVIVDWGVYQIYLYPKSTSADYYAILIASIMMAMSIVIIKIYEGLGEKAELETRNTIYQRQVEAYRVQSSERGNAKRISSSET